MWTLNFAYIQIFAVFSASGSYHIFVFRPRYELPNSIFHYWLIFSIQPFFFLTSLSIIMIVILNSWSVYIFFSSDSFSRDLSYCFVWNIFSYLFFLYWIKSQVYHFISVFISDLCLILNIWNIYLRFFCCCLQLSPAGTDITWAIVWELLPRN